MHMNRIVSAFAGLFLGLAVATAADAASLVAKISIADQTMTVYKDGFAKYSWPVSTARKGYYTPTGSYTAKWASRNHHSKKYDNAPMPFAIFFNGGYAVHATFDVKRLGSPASHGCVRLHPENAATFYQLALEEGLGNTRIIIRQ